MNPPTEKEIRLFLEHALKEKDVEWVKLAIRLSFAYDIPIEKMTDLHFSALLLLAAPEQEKRGRKKDPRANALLYRLNLACKVKSAILGDGFSSVWAAYCDKTRPTIRDEDLWQCSNILLMLLDQEEREASIAIRTFELTKQQLERYALVNK